MSNIEDLKPRFWRVLNVFENDSGSPETDYSTLYIYGDGPNDKKQITIGRGITEFGNMKALLLKYKEINGQYADKFESYLSSIGRSQLYNDDNFKKLLVLAAKNDKGFRDAEDYIFEQKYWVPAYRFFTEGKLTLPLSMMVILDSYLQSGSILGFLRMRFNENLPNAGGNEKEWVKQYVDARHNWLKNHSRKILRNTIYRTQFLKDEIAKDNWTFNCPLTPNEVKIC